MRGLGEIGGREKEGKGKGAEKGVKERTEERRGVETLSLGNNGSF